MSTTLRRFFRTQRSNLPPETLQSASYAVISHLLTLSVFKKSHHIALYSPVKGEIDLTALLSLMPEKQFYFPFMHEEPGKMDFFLVHHLSELTPNRLGIPEPTVKAHGPVDANKLDLVLLPLVAFDAHGHRLGAGGGYYDRYFEFTKHSQHQPPPFLMGVAYDFQKTACLPHHDWDVPMDGVITESSVLLFSRLLQ